MNPFGKPLANVTSSDIRRLCAAKVREGQYLEFKQEVATPEFGRTKLLREVVAFANADGGVLIIGVSEADHCADTIKPLPGCNGHAETIERQIAACVEPRLPSVAVVPVVTEEDGTSGVVVIEVGSSRLGPHGVLPSREVAIRRGEQCVAMTMQEIHSLTIRNARRFDDIAAVLASRSKAFQNHVLTTYSPEGKLLRAPYIGITTLEALSATARAEGSSLSAIRITVVPHHDLGIARLERSTDLKPQCGLLLDSNGRPDESWGEAWFGGYNVPKLTFGGLERHIVSDHIETLAAAKRDGFVEVWWISRHGERGYLSVGGLAFYLTTALRMFTGLRAMSSSLIMPAELNVELVSLGKVVVAHPKSDRFYREPGRPLNVIENLGTRTIADVTEFETILEDVAADVLNAGGLPSSFTPDYRLSAP